MASSHWRARAVALELAPVGRRRPAVDRLLRWVSPIKYMARTLTRDGRTFDEPGRFDIRRDPNVHLPFGFGPHYCMGSNLARLELRVMFDELLRRLPDLDLAGAPLPRRESNFISGPEAMPVEFTPITS